MRNPDDGSEAEILRCLDGKCYREAFEHIVTAYRDKNLRTGFAITGNTALAEEAAQEAFLRIWRALPGYRRQASVSTWIYTIARNTCLSYAKAQSRCRTVPLEASSAGSPAGEQRSGALDVRHLISRLPEQYRPVVVLYYMEDRSYEEVARLLDMPLGTVKTYLHRARKRLAAAVIADRVVTGDG